MATRQTPDGGHWVLGSAGPARPGLRVEVAAGRKLLIRQSERVVLLGRQRTGPVHYGVYYARTGRYRSPLPPVTAAHARRIREASKVRDDWAARWVSQFGSWLDAAAEGPLQAWSGFRRECGDFPAASAGKSPR